MEKEIKIDRLTQDLKETEDEKHELREEVSDYQ